MCLRRDSLALNWSDVRCFENKCWWAACTTWVNYQAKGVSKKYLEKFSENQTLPSSLVGRMFRILLCEWREIPRFAQEGSELESNSSECIGVGARLIGAATFPRGASILHRVNQRRCLGVRTVSGLGQEVYDLTEWSFQRPEWPLTYLDPLRRSFPIVIALARCFSPALCMSCPWIRASVSLSLYIYIIYWALWEMIFGLHPTYEWRRIPGA
jgi:hypothetical protein